eukprot:Amastigsp_a180682_32.p4 type:complete len:102 gc:universal Amastigsp_a180682_32:1165-860(-)
MEAGRDRRWREARDRAALDDISRRARRPSIHVQLQDQHLTRVARGDCVGSRAPRGFRRTPAQRHALQPLRQRKASCGLALGLGDRSCGGGKDRHGFAWFHA